MWRHLILSIILSNFAFADDRWSAKMHEGEVIILCNNNKEAFIPDLKGLETLLSSQADDAAFRHLCFWNYLENDPQIQRELTDVFKAKHPDMLQVALNSAGNMHNPKVLPLRAVFSECLLATPSVQKIDALFRKRGYTVSSVSHEKFRIDKTSNPIQFKAITWLKITKAEQDGTDQPATALESKLEGNDKPKPESEGRSQ